MANKRQSLEDGTERDTVAAFTLPVVLCTL